MMGVEYVYQFNAFRPKLMVNEYGGPNHLGLILPCRRDEISSFAILPVS
jgi:hypothetical protein